MAIIGYSLFNALTAAIHIDASGLPVQRMKDVGDSPALMRVSTIPPRQRSEKLLLV